MQTRALPILWGRMKKVLILGSTGSIGTQALDVIARSANLQVVGLAAGTGWELAVEQAREHGVPTVALADPAAAEQARGAWSGRVLAGEEGVTELIASSGADLVLNGIVGAAGLGLDRGRPDRGDRRRPRQQGEPGAGR